MIRERLKTGSLTLSRLWLYINKNGSSPFVKYGNVFIRKRTALYLIEENYQLSSDRLLWVRGKQPEHLFSISEHFGGPSTSIHSGDLYIFKPIDTKQTKYLLGWQMAKYAQQN